MTFTDVPDGVEVFATRADADGLALAPLLIVDAVTGFLDSHDLGEGPIRWRRIGDGHSNITYQVERGDAGFVLRRGPRPPFPRSSHDMVREARIQRLLGAEGIAVPTILAVCEDDSILGVPFYVMSYVPGEVITDDIPIGLNSEAGRRGIAEALVDSLAGLHRIEPRGELATLGRPEGYLARQVDRLSGLWPQYSTRALPIVDELATWLRQNMPPSPPARVVHGDFRMGNLMFAPDPPARVLAILDWEMATLGDPLADLGYLAATYTVSADGRTPLELSPVTAAPGFLDRVGLIDRYAGQLPFDRGVLPWYEALALWKGAIVIEAIYTRWLRGERPGDEFGPTLATGIPHMLEVARTIATG